MKVFFLVMVFAVNLSFAGVYKMTIKRVGTNVYESDAGVIVKTKYCYEYAYSEEAVLKYEKYSYDNKLIFLDSGESCDVEEVFQGLDG